MHRVALCPESAVLGPAAAALGPACSQSHGRCDPHTDMGAERGPGTGHVEHRGSRKYTVSLGMSMFVVSRRTPSHLRRGSAGISFLSHFS